MKNKYDLKYFQQLFSSNNCELFNDSYDGINSVAHFKCNIHPEMGMQHHNFASSVYNRVFCKYCGYERSSQKQLDNISIEKLQKDFLDKGLVLIDDIYRGVKAKYRCRCAVHEDQYLEIVYDNLKKRKIKGCDICRNQFISLKKRTPEFKIKEKVENIGLIYDHCEYTGRDNLGTVVYYLCPKHKKYGIQQKRLSKLNMGQGCPYCNQSHGEREIEKFLIKYKIDYIPQYRFKDLVGVGGLFLSYDFYLPGYNLLIEFQGIQHEKPVEIFQVKRNAFAIQKEHDSRKRDYAKEHNYSLLEIWYWDLFRISDILYSTIIGEQDSETKKSGNDSYQEKELSA